MIIRQPDLLSRAEGRKLIGSGFKRLTSTHGSIRASSHTAEAAVIFVLTTLLRNHPRPFLGSELVGFLFNF